MGISNGEETLVHVVLALHTLFQIAALEQLCLQHSQCRLRTIFLYDSFGFWSYYSFIHDNLWRGYVHVRMLRRVWHRG